MDDKRPQATDSVSALEILIQQLDKHVSSDYTSDQERLREQITSDQGAYILKQHLPAAVKCDEELKATTTSASLRGTECLTLYC